MYADAFGAAGFWLAVAAMIVAVVWSRSRREQMKHETLRRIVEKTGQVDEEQLKALFQPPATDSWLRQSEPSPGAGYRALRILGVLTVVFAVGLAAFAGLMLVFAARFADFPDELDLWPVFPIAIGIAIFGCGLFYCSRFLPKPLPEGSARNDRA